MPKIGAAGRITCLGVFSRFVLQERGSARCLMQKSGQLVFCHLDDDVASRRSHGLRSWDILTHEVLPSALLARKTAKNLKMTRKHELGVSTAFHVDWISPFLSRKASSRRDFPSCSRLFAVSRAISTHLNRFRLSVWYERASIGQGDFVGATKTPMPIQFLLLAAWK